VTPEEKFELLKRLLEQGMVVETRYRRRRVVALERPSERYVVVSYSDGCKEKMRLSTFARRRFVVIV
jgi:hypothetical protein